jgi:hypothetical protein
MVPFQSVLLFYTCIVVFAETRSKGNFLMLVGVCYLLKEKDQLYSRCLFGMFTRRTSWGIFVVVRVRG